jgi:hypothetical protein
MLLINQPPLVFQVATTKIHGPGSFPTTQAHPHAQPNSPHANTPLHDSPTLQPQPPHADKTLSKATAPPNDTNNASTRQCLMARP